MVNDSGCQPLGLCRPEIPADSGNSLMFAWRSGPLNGGMRLREQAGLLATSQQLRRPMQMLADWRGLLSRANGRRITGVMAVPVTLSSNAGGSLARQSQIGPQGFCGSRAHGILPWRSALQQKMRRSDGACMNDRGGDLTNAGTCRGLAGRRGAGEHDPLSQ